MCVRESGASSSAKHQSNTQHQATLSAGAACFFVAPAGKRSSCKRESLVLGHACKSPLHERPKHLHSATMCSAVHQPFEDGDDTSCGPACIVAFNAKIQADYDESLAWLEVDEEPRTRAGATLPKSPWMPSLSCGVSSRATDGIQISSSQASSRCWKPAGTV